VGVPVRAGCPGVYGGGGLITVKSQKNKAKLIKIV